MAYKKSHIDQHYYIKHLGSRIAVWALTNYYIIDAHGLPKTSEEWALFALLNIAQLFGAQISLQGATRIAKASNK